MIWGWEGFMGILLSEREWERAGLSKNPKNLSNHPLISGNPPKINHLSEENP
jgi:hypothetical protein